MSEVIKFVSIEQFRSVRMQVERRAQYQGLQENGDPILDLNAVLPTLPFLGLVKGHGTNFGVVFKDGEIQYQSRERVITPLDDNYGVARHFHLLPDEVKAHLSALVGGNGALYFEWLGKGIQANVATCQVPRFAMLIGAKSLNDDEGWIPFKDFVMPNEHGIYNAYQFGTFEMNIDFQNPGEDVNKLNELTLAVEKECPIGKFFGVSSIGEGIVWKCVEPGYGSSRFWFKVKGSEHSNSKVKKLATADVEKVKSVSDFVEKHLDEERLMQAWNHLIENKHPLEPTSTGIFIKWCHNDIIKEYSDELIASNLTAKDLGSVLAPAARKWFLTKLN